MIKIKDDSNNFYFILATKLNKTIIFGFIMPVKFNPCLIFDISKQHIPLIKATNTAKTKSRKQS
jgi:hypothetical protein